MFEGGASESGLFRFKVKSRQKADTSTPTRQLPPSDPVLTLIQYFHVFFCYFFGSCLNIVQYFKTCSKPIVYCSPELHVFIT